MDDTTKMTDVESWFFNNLIGISDEVAKCDGMSDLSAVAKHCALEVQQVLVGHKTHIQMPEYGKDWYGWDTFEEYLQYGPLDTEIRIRLDITDWV